MQLSLFSDYALRSLLFLALRDGKDEPVEISAIAEAYGISRHHLVKVVHRLGQLGYVETRRGRSGGIRLAREPRDIRLGELVRATEPSAALLACLEAEAEGTKGREICRIAPVCRLKGFLREAEEAFHAALDRHTLAEVCEPRSGLRALLMVSTGGAPA